MNELYFLLQKSSIDAIDYNSLSEMDLLYDVFYSDIYKGLEADAVIILDAGSENYTMRASELHKRILFGAGIKTDCIDAACLWYVAITRAKHFLCFYSYDKEISYKRI